MSLIVGAPLVFPRAGAKIEAMLRLCALVVLASSFQVAADVSDDAALRAALSSAKPGDVIKIASGTYRGGVSATLRGDKDRPIVIDAADDKSPPVFEGGGVGLHLIASKYVTIRNLRFHGASGNGINIDDGGKRDTPAVGIVIEKIDVQDVGPRGNCDAIKMSGVREFVVRDCFISGWGGQAIDLVGCADGVIERCVVRGKAGFEQATGPQMKGGTSRVTVRDCFFDHAGERAINAGGSTGLDYFRPVDANYEAKDLTIEDCVFVGGQAAVAFVGVDGAVFRHNTIREPQKWVLRILQETREERFVRCRNVMFERNLIVYQRANVGEVANIGPDTQPETFTFKENWWWCADAPSVRPELPSAERGGVYGRDPKVGAGAKDYGARTAKRAEASKN
jgi:hypothetical protein